MSEKATDNAPIYRIVEQDNDCETQRYMITCDEGWRQSIVCENMYLWAAEWLIGVIGRSPYAPNSRP